MVRDSSEKGCCFTCHIKPVSEVGERGERWKERYDEEANKKQMELAWKKEGRRR